MKRPRYSEGFVSTVLACVCVCCVCHTRRTGDWVSVEESPGLSCYCTFYPKRDPHSSLLDNFPPYSPFWGEEGRGGGARRIKASSWRKKKKIPLDIFPPLSCPSLGVKSSGGGQGCSVSGAHVIWLGESSKQAACAESLPVWPLTL